MLYLIFGEDIVNSRKKLTELAGDSAVYLDGKKTNLSEIDTNLVSDSLFATKKTLVIEKFTKVKPQSDFFEKVLGFDKDSNINVILWEKDSITPKVKTAFKNTTTYAFDFPKYYFTFMDGFIPGSKTSVKLLPEVLKIFEAEQILYGLIRRVRQLLILKTGEYQEFAEFKYMQSWQLSKLNKQASAWEEVQLKEVFIKLAELDELMKSGGLTMPLVSHLDIIMLQD